MKNIFKNYVLIIILAVLSGTTSCFAENANGIWINDSRNLFSRNQAIVLAINIRNFNAVDKNGDDIINTDNGEQTGTFLNAIERLDELKNSGINTVHILPVTPTGKIKAIGTAGSLYAISDFSRLNPQLDDTTNNMTVEQEAKKFVRECHKRNIRVIFDLPSCGSYDLYLSNPNLFAKDANNQPIIPADWTDVRLFKTTNPDGSLNDELYIQYRKYIDLVQSIGADGIRADVATSKPFMFWKKLISYARNKDQQFLFLAEASESWTQPIAENASFTSYNKLLEAGFDSWYGSFFNFKDWKTQDQLENQLKLIKSTQKNCTQTNISKSVIGSFATHDEVSPIITGGKPFSEMIMWLSATLPVNSYFVDGFQSGDAYQYKYANQKAEKTFTDDNIYYVHNGKFDIFNFSRKPGSINNDLKNDFIISNRFKNYANEIINKGTVTFLKTNNPDVFAYIYDYRYSSILVILNKNLIYNNSVSLCLKNHKPDEMIMPLKFDNPPNIIKNRISTDLKPGEINVYLISREDKKSQQENANMIPVYR